MGQTVGQSGNPGCVDLRVPGVRSTVPLAMLADRQNNTGGYAAPCPLPGGGGVGAKAGGTPAGWRSEVDDGTSTTFDYEGDGVLPTEQHAF